MSGEADGRRRWLRYGAVALILLLLVVGVLWLRRDRSPDFTVTPPEPLLEPIDAERERPLSSLAVPVQLPVGMLLDALEEAVPRTWGSLDEKIRVPNDRRKEFAIEMERTLFEASVAGSMVTLSTTVSYRLKAWHDPPILPPISGSCGDGRGEARPRMQITVESPIDISSDWRLQTDLRVTDVRPATATRRDECKVTIFQIDVTGALAKAAEDFIRGQRREVDRLVGEVDVRSLMESYWKLLSSPLRLGDDLWLVIDPHSVQRGSVRGEGDTVTVLVDLAAHPRIVVGAEPPAFDRPLPDLENTDVAPGLVIELEGRISYREIEGRLQRELAGMELTTARRLLRLEEIGVSAAAGGKLALRARVGGDVEAELYVVGTPDYHPGTGLITVPDLGFDMNTQHGLVGNVAWLADSGIERALRRRATWQARPAVAWAEERLREGLNLRLGPDVRLQGDVAELEVESVSVEPETLVVRALARAKATLIVELHD